MVCRVRALDAFVPAGSCGGRLTAMLLGQQLQSTEFRWCKSSAATIPACR
jgi:hypothetical protein